MLSPNNVINLMEISTNFQTNMFDLITIWIQEICTYILIIVHVILFLTTIEWQISLIYFFAYSSKTSLDSNFHFEMTFINLEFCQGTKNIIMTKSVEKNSLITLAISCILLSEKKYLKITFFRTKKFVPN